MMYKSYCLCTNKICWVKHLWAMGLEKLFIAIRDWFHITPGVQKKRGITVHEACKDTFGRLSYNPWTGTLLCFFTRAHGVGQVLLITLVLIGLPCGTTLCNCLQCHVSFWVINMLKPEVGVQITIPVAECI